MINFALLNVNIQGAHFSWNVRFRDLSLFERNTCTVYNYYILNDSQLDANESQTKLCIPDNDEAQTSNSNQSSSLESSQPMADAPFEICTTLSFADRDIRNFRVLHITTELPLFVIDSGSTEIELSPQPEFLVSRQGKGCRIDCHRQWKHNKTFEYEIPTEYPPENLNRLPNSTLKTQLWWGKDKSLSLYRLPRNRVLKVAGQDVIFSSGVFESIYCVIIRGHQGRRIFVKKMALIGCPSHELSEVNENAKSNR